MSFEVAVTSSLLLLWYILLGHFERTHVQVEEGRQMSVNPWAGGADLMVSWAFLVLCVSGGGTYSGCNNSSVVAAEAGDQRKDGKAEREIL